MAPKNLSAALLVLRLGGAFFLFAWASLKFIRPEWMVSVYNKTYGWEFVTNEFAYGVGVVQLIVAVCFLIGYQRTAIYGFVVLIHSTGVAAAIPRLMNYSTFPHNRYLTTVTALAAFIALFMMRESDTYTVDHARKKRGEAAGSGDFSA